MDKHLLSIIVPTFNEEKTVLTIMDRLITAKYPCDFEIVFINDGSTDSTCKKIRSLQPAIRNLRIISYEKNKGKGFAVKAGLAEARGDLFIINDADLEYDPAEIPGMIELLVNGEADVVIGDRMASVKNKNIYYLFNITLSFLISWLFGRKINDFGCCYKAFTQKVKDRLDLTLNDFGFDIEFVIKVIRNKFDVVQIPVQYSPRTIQEGKKIKWTDGIKALVYIIKFKFFSWN